MHLEQFFVCLHACSGVYGFRMHVMCKCMCVHVNVVGSHVYMLVWILRGARLSRCLRALAGFDKSSLVRLCKVNHQCMCMQSKRVALHIQKGTRICTKYRSIANAGRWLRPICLFTEPRNTRCPQNFACGDLKPKSLRGKGETQAST